MDYIKINDQTIKSKNFIKLIKQKIFKSFLQGGAISLNISYSFLDKIIQYFNEFTVQEQLILLNSSIYLIEELNHKYGGKVLDTYSKDQLFSNFSLFNSSYILQYLIDNHPEEALEAIKKSSTKYGLMYIATYPDKVNKALDFIPNKIEFLVELFFEEYIKSKILYKILALKGEKFQIEFITNFLNSLDTLNDYKWDEPKIKIGEHFFYLCPATNEGQTRENATPSINKTAKALLTLLRKGALLPPTKSVKTLPFKLFQSSQFLSSPE